MQGNSTTILSTRPLGQLAALRAKEAGFELEEISFIETSAIVSDSLTNYIESLLTKKAAVIFTSMNAVEAVIAMLNQRIPDWECYCIGQTTKELIETYFGKNSIRATGINAIELAAKIIEKSTHEELFFFCGNQRRPELPEALSTAGFQLQELIVYETTATPITVSTSYAGILFFSPSAVHSYFSTNQPNPDTVLFAIGSTTANAINEHSTNKIITAHVTDKQALLDLALTYLHQFPQSSDSLIIDREQ